VKIAVFPPLRFPQFDATASHRLPVPMFLNALLTPAEEGGFIATNPEVIGF
jgi:hypothetical protein